MKNRTLIFSIISFILGGGIVFLYMRNNKSQLTESNTHQIANIKNTFSEKIDKLIGNHPHANINVGHDFAQIIVRNYVPPGIPDRTSPDGATVTKGNTQAVWFDIHTLAELINSVGSLTKGDGVRFYLAAYPDKFVGIDYRGHQQNYSKATTLVLVPTVTGADGVTHIDYDGSTPTMPADYENKGEVCPPPSNCNTGGATLLPAPSPAPAKSHK